MSNENKDSLNASYEMLILRIPTLFKVIRDYKEIRKTVDLDAETASSLILISYFLQNAWNVETDLYLKGMVPRIVCEENRDDPDLTGLIKEMILDGHTCIDKDYPDFKHRLTKSAHMDILKVSVARSTMHLATAMPSNTIN